MMRLRSLVSTVALCAPLWAAAQVTILRSSAAELSTSRADRVSYAVRTDQPGHLTLEILTGDGDVVRTVVSPTELPAGEHEVVWDGRDDKGQPVPDEAYCPRVTLISGKSHQVDDPCTRTGGEVISGIQPQVAVSGDISYALEFAGRVLIRVGVKNGAMLRSLSVWRPRPAGRNLQRWNGFDEGGLVDLRNERLAILVTAFRLPDHSVITTGQETLDYRGWRQAKGWPELPDASQGAAVQPLERKGQRIARQHYMARYKDREPRITVTLVGRDGKPVDTAASVPDEVRVLVDLHPDDRWLMQEQLYEVAFFVNGDFVSEEENGYVPIGWIWNTSSLASGRHLLSVNLTGFTGRVGTRTVALSR